MHEILFMYKRSRERSPRTEEPVWWAVSWGPIFGKYHLSQDVLVFPKSSPSSFWGFQKSLWLGCTKQLIAPFVSPGHALGIFPSHPSTSPKSQYCLNSVQALKSRYYGKMLHQRESSLRSMCATQAQRICFTIIYGSRICKDVFILSPGGGEGGYKYLVSEWINKWINQIWTISQDMEITSLLGTECFYVIH